MPKCGSLRIRAALGILLIGAMPASGLDPEQAPTPLPTPEPLYRKVKVSLGYHFSSGDYGESESTDIHYVPLVVTGEIDRWSAQLTVPYLSVSGPGGFIEGGPVGPLETNGDGDGLGDIILRASYLLPWRDSWPDWVPFIGLAGLVKFPTASRGDGLGTGEFDFGIDSELTWAIRPLTPFATLGGRFLGDLPDTELRNVFIGSVGAAYQVLDSVGAGLMLDYRQRSSSSSGNRLELVPFGAWKVIPHWSVEIYAAAGLASGSPDVGVGVQVGYTWW
jgi:hypothetical protein